MYAQVRSPRFVRRKRSPAPAIIIAVGALILGCWVFNLTCGRGGGREVDTSALAEYVNRVRPLIDTSTSVGASWLAIHSQIPQLVADIEGLGEQLKGVEQSCLDLLDQAKGVEVPKGVETTHAALLICLEQRYRATKNYRSDLLNSLTAVDLDVYANSISQDLQELVYSDGVYRFYRRALSEALEDGGMQEIAPLPDSIWLPEWEQASFERVKAFLVNIKATEVRGVAVGTVAIEPQGTVVKEGSDDVHRLPSTEEITLTVDVQNQGNRAENDVTLRISLYTAADPTPVRQEQVIDVLAPGETVKVEIRGLRPTAGGVRNILEVIVDPVPQETFLENNQKLIYFTVG